MVFTTFLIIAVIAYILADGKELLLDLLIGTALILVDVYAVIVCGVVCPIVTLAIIVVGPILRIFFICDTEDWLGKAHSKITLGAFKPFSKIANDRKRRAAIPIPIPKPKPKHKKPVCLNCGGPLLAGPEAGDRVNVMCDNCGARFNYSYFDGSMEPIDVQN